MSFPRRAVALAATVTLLGGATTALAARTLPSDRPAPRAAPTAMASVRGVWNGNDAASVVRVREIVAAQTGQAATTLARCRAASDRPRYMRCALAPLAMLGSSGQVNATILLNVDQDRPGARCDALIRWLAGSDAMLGTVARSTLRNDLPAATARRDVNAASRTVEALARDTFTLTHNRRWRHACDPATA